MKKGEIIMKRLALLLGSLLVVTAAASAKEVVPAPVVVEEAPVQIVEKEVIVYRDKEEGFRPNGFVDVQYRYYGETEGKREEWNADGNEMGRLQILGEVALTENQTLGYRTRQYNSFESNTVKNENETKLYYTYNHGTLEGTNVGTSSFVEYIKKEQKQSVEYRYLFDLADYMFNNDFVKTTKFVVGPRVKYTWYDDNNAGHDNTLGIYLDWINQLPYGFSTEVELDGVDYTTNDVAKYQDGKDSKPDSFDLSVAAKIMHDANLYTNGAYSLAWHFEGGYDTYNWSNRDKYAVGNHYDDSTYALYAQPSLVLNYQATEFVNLYAQAGAEYRNWNVQTESNAQTWRWQPFAIVGFNVAF